MVKQNKIIKKFSNQNIPLVAFIELTNRCNLKCIHCMRSKNDPADLSADLFKKTVSHLAQMGTLNLTLSGGEPLLHNEFFYFLTCAKEMGFNITIASNATCLSAEKILILKRFKPISIQISIYGATAYTHDNITRKKGSYKKTLDAIKLLHNAGISTLLRMIVMKENFSDLKKVIDMAKNKNWNLSTDFIIYPGDNGSLKPLCHRISDEQLKIALKKKLINKKDFHGNGSAGSQTKEIIDLANISCRISSSGDVFPSGTLRLELDNLKRMSFLDIWQKSPLALKLRELQRSQFECINCEHYSTCSWDIGLAYAEHHKITSSPKEWCRICKMTMNLLTPIST